MWIRMTKTVGSYFKGLPYDVSDAVVMQLPKESYNRCPAPWDARKGLRARKTKGPRGMKRSEYRAAKSKEAKTPKDKQVRPDKTEQGVRTK